MTIVEVVPCKWNNNIVLRLTYTRSSTQHNTYVYIAAHIPTFHPRHIPIGKVWIYRLLFLCLSVRLRISPARIKLAASNFERWFKGVLGRHSPILGNFVSKKPKIGRISHPPGSKLHGEKSSRNCVPINMARRVDVWSVCVDKRQSPKTDVIVYSCLYSWFLAADRPTRRSASRPPCSRQMSTVSVINCDRWRSPVYHTDRPPKLTAPETISRSRDMVGAHQNLNGSRDLTTPLSEIVSNPWASNWYLQRTYQMRSLYLHSLWRYERRYKMSNMGWLGVVRAIQGHWTWHHSIEHNKFTSAFYSNYVPVLRRF